MGYYWVADDKNTLLYGETLPEGKTDIGPPPTSYHDFDPSTGGWKLRDGSYRERRANNYPAIPDQLDAILKYLMTKSDLTPDLQFIINAWQLVKISYPKS